MDQINVSIIVPVYNVQDYLAKCVDSILSQTVEDFELILVDDGSTDNCPDICDSYQHKDGRVKVIHKTNGGLSSARNAGLEPAVGKYIYFVDSDDYLEPTLLEKTIAVMEQHQSDWCCFGMIKEDSEGNFIENVSFKPIEITVTNEDERMRFLLKYLLNYRTGWEACDHIFRGDIIREHQLRFAGERISFGEDLLFSFTYWLYARSCVAIEDSLYHYVQRKNSLLWGAQFRNILPEVHGLARKAYAAVVNAGMTRIREDFAAIYLHLMEWHARPYVAQKGFEWVKNEIRKLGCGLYLPADPSELQDLCQKIAKRYGKEDGFVTVAITVLSESAVPHAAAYIRLLLKQTLQKLDILVLSAGTWDLQMEDARIRQITADDPQMESIVRAFFKKCYGEYLYFADCSTQIPVRFLEKMSDVLKYNGCSTAIITAEQPAFVDMYSLSDRRMFRKYIQENGISRRQVMFRTDLLEESGLACMDHLHEFTADIILSGHTIFVQENAFYAGNQESAN